MRSQSWILHYLGYLCKFHRTFSRMQKASQSVRKTWKPDGRVIFTPQKWIKNQIYNPCTRSWDRIETCRFLTPVKETSEHMRSPYSTAHIYGLERAISSPGVPFCRPSLTKGSRPLRKRSVLNTKSPWISALPLREVGYIKYIKYGNWITGWRLLSIILGLKTFQSWLILFPPLQALYYSDGNTVFSRRHAPCHATDQFRSQLTLTLTVAILGPSARPADRRVRCGPGNGQMTTGKVLMTSLPSQRGHCQNGRDAKNCQEVRIG